MTERPQSLSGAVFWMLGAVVFLTTMAVAGRELAGDMSIFEIMFFRNAICLAILCAMILHYGRHLFRTQRLRLHGFRNFVHFFAQAGWYFGVVYLPLAEVFAIEFTTPIWTAILAAIFLAERLTPLRIAGTLLGFAGVLVILRPGVEIVDPAALVVLGAAFGFAVTFVVTRSMAPTETPLTLLFYMNLVQLPMAAAAMLPHWVWPQAEHWPWIALTGLAGLGSHYCFARAFALADAALVAPIDFVRLPLAALLGYMVYQEPTNVFVFVGAAVIFAGNLLNLRGERRGR